MNHQRILYYTLESGVMAVICSQSKEIDTNVIVVLILIYASSFAQHQGSVT